MGHFLNHSSRVEGNDILSESMKMTNGIPQESILAHLLLQFFMNYILYSITSKNTQYADNMKIWAPLDDAVTL